MVAVQPAEAYDLSDGTLTTASQLSYNRVCGSDTLPLNDLAMGGIPITIYAEYYSGYTDMCGGAGGIINLTMPDSGGDLVFKDNRISQEGTSKSSRLWTFVV